MENRHIAISYEEWIPQNTFDEFVSIVRTEACILELKEREQAGLYAALEWLIPSAAIVFISKSYFDAFLNEMGKNHYHLLKNGLNTLWSKFFGPGAPGLELVGSQGKTHKEQRYSLTLSIVAETDTDIRVKLLLQNGISKDIYHEIIKSFLDFMDLYYNDTLPDDKVEMLKSSRIVGRTLLLTYDLSKASIVAVDPISRPKPKSDEI